MIAQATSLKKFLLFFTICALELPLMAQITLGAADAPVIGDVFDNFVDLMPADTIQPGMPGPDQVWDFSNLQALDAVKQAAIDPANAFGGDQFPNATFALTTEGAINTQFAQTTTDAVLGIGIVLPNPLTGDTEILSLNPTQTVANFPTNYNDNYVDNFGFVLGIPSFIDGIDSVRVTNTTTTWKEIDAWGTMMLPEGNYDVLRSRDSISSITLIEGLLGFFWVPVQVDTQLTLDYNFLSSESKGNLVNMNMSLDGSAVNQVSWVSLSDEEFDLPVADFSFEILGDPALREFEFTDLSTNAPDAWAWTFGDGNAGGVQNPIHQYENNGTYTVCLTASNLAGVNMVCKTIEVDVEDPPVAAFSYTSDGFNSFDFTDESTNSPTSWLWDFGDGMTSTQQHPMHEYELAGDYTVCLEVTNSTGSDQTCQTITVVVVQAPLASFSWVGDLLEVTFTDLSSNGPTQWLWDFGDGMTSIDQHPIHTYATGGNFDVCLTASNSEGSDMICQEVPIIIPATANLWPAHWSIRPNPTSDAVLVVLDASANGAQLILSNALGQNLQVANYNGSQTFSLADYPKGVYLLRIVQDNELLGTHKLIKQ